MIDELKPYPKYKESGLPWLGRVPEYWSVQRIKTVLQENGSRSVDGVGMLLALTRQRGLIPRGDMTEKIHNAKTLVGYEKYKPGQIVMNRMQAWSGMFGAGLVEGLISPDYAVFDITSGHNVKIVLERLKSPDMVEQFALESKGIGDGFNRLYTDRFGAITISLPPPDEQAAIVRFLDRANGKIERVVRKLLADVAVRGAGKRYLIQHSAGSGKSNSIAWLAHQFIGVQKNGKALFDSIVVITDRRILDHQIQETIKQFAQVGATVGHAEHSGDLRKFIESGKKIIITTVQKFPFILDEIGK